jgi:hydroxyacylglutathione hydrolase
MSYDLVTFKCRTDNVGALIRDHATGFVTAIDAPEEEPILKALQDQGWTLHQLVITHSHHDHIGAILPLKQRFGCTVIMPEKARSVLPPADRYVREGESLSFGSLKAEVWETPGHLNDLAVYYLPKIDLMFCSDNLSSLGCGRAALQDYDKLFRSLQRIAVLPDQTKLVFGHDYHNDNLRFSRHLFSHHAEFGEEAGRSDFVSEGVLGDQKKANLFLRSHDPVIAKHLGMEGASAFAVFTALREAKRQFS